MPPIRAINLAQQLAGIVAVLPDARGSVHRGELSCIVQLQPTPASRTYTIRLVYRHGRRPCVTVVDPPLALHPDARALPHVYPKDELCLYYPGQWSHDMLLAKTILPWTAEWLNHYELWLITGRWAGGGHADATEALPSPGT
ncbi:hypothetical protein ACIBQ6_21320 [Nonomuraea sp. NPDC049655]|uniref:hypothetical protein n=1 Tax=Nonomuraea sp. NPDC049655 TaxID=3364355 RepID=UPI00379E7886